MNLSVASEYTYIEKSCLTVLVIEVAHSMVKVNMVVLDRLVRCHNGAGNMGEYRYTV